MTISDEQIARLRALEKDASAAPWHAEHCGHSVFSGKTLILSAEENDYDAFIAVEVRNALPALIDAAEQMLRWDDPNATTYRSQLVSTQAELEAERKRADEAEADLRRYDNLIAHREAVVTAVNTCASERDKAQQYAESKTALIKDYENLLSETRIERDAALAAKEKAEAERDEVADNYRIEKASLIAVKRERDAALAAREKAEGERDEYIAAVQTRNVKLTEAWAEIERLKAALKPFAKTPIGVVEDDGPIFDRCADDTVIYQTYGWPDDPTSVVTVGDIRTARAALKGQTDGE